MDPDLPSSPSGSLHGRRVLRQSPKSWRLNDSACRGTSSDKEGKSSVVTKASSSRGLREPWGTKASWAGTGSLRSRAGPLAPYGLCGQWAVVEGGGCPRRGHAGGPHCCKATPRPQGTGSQSGSQHRERVQLALRLGALRSLHTQMPGPQLQRVQAHRGPQALQRPVGVSFQKTGSGQHPRASPGNEPLQMQRSLKKRTCRSLDLQV